MGDNTDNDQPDRSFAYNDAYDSDGEEHPRCFGANITATDGEYKVGELIHPLPEFTLNPLAMHPLYGLRLDEVSSCDPGVLRLQLCMRDRCVSQPVHGTPEDYERVTANYHHYIDYAPVGAKLPKNILQTSDVSKHVYSDARQALYILKYTHKHDGSTSDVRRAFIELTKKVNAMLATILAGSYISGACIQHVYRLLCAYKHWYERLRSEGYDRIGMPDPVDNAISRLETMALAAFRAVGGSQTLEDIRAYGMKLYPYNVPDKMVFRMGLVNINHHHGVARLLRVRLYPELMAPRYYYDEGSAPTTVDNQTVAALRPVTPVSPMSAASSGPSPTPDDQAGDQHEVVEHPMSSSDDESTLGHADWNMV